MPFGFGSGVRAHADFMYGTQQLPQPTNYIISSIGLNSEQHRIESNTNGCNLSLRCSSLYSVFCTAVLLYLILFPANLPNVLVSHAPQSRPYRYVHTLTKGAPSMANTFALKYSLPRLAQSLAQFWSSSAEAEWEECVRSLLEVTSSVALMTGERNILPVLDANVYGGVAEVRTQPTVCDFFPVFIAGLFFCMKFFPFFVVPHQ